MLSWLAQCCPLAHSAFIFLCTQGAAPDQPDKHGVAALWCASAAGKLEVLQALLELGANADRLHPETHASPLLASCTGGHKDCVAALLDHGLTDVDKGTRYDGIGDFFCLTLQKILV